jgi:hypothetical protein
VPFQGVIRLVPTSSQGVALRWILAAFQAEVVSSGGNPGAIAVTYPRELSQLLSTRPRNTGEFAVIVLASIIKEKEFAMTTVRARFDGKVFVPEKPVDLPAGCELEISFAAPENESPGKTPLARLAEILDQLPANPDWPPDGAAQHDHYLYGTPKRP